MERGAGRPRTIYLLLVPIYVALLCVGFYDRIEPGILGIPFFYWYQLFWVLLGSALLYPVYRREEAARK